MDSKRVNRNDKFCSSVKRKDVSCVLSNADVIQCEVAHIVPLNGVYGQNNYKNPQLLNDDANGMLLSRELHYLYDQFIWCIDPNKFKEIEGIPKKRKYKIVISQNYIDKKVAIINFKDVELRAECHHFIELAYKIFLNKWNPPEEEYKKLEINQQSFLNNEKKFNSVEDIEGLSYELHEIILDCKKNKKNFGKKKKLELCSKYNIHEQSLEAHYKKYKKDINLRNKYN